MARPSENDLQTVCGPFPGGENNIANETSIPRGQCRSAENIDFYPGGRYRRRAGPEQVLAINGGGNSGWSNSAKNYALARVGNLLQRFTPGKGMKTLYTGLHPDNLMVFCEVNQYIFVSDGVRSLRIDPATDTVRSWGLDEPRGQSTLAMSPNGGLEEGSYQVALTYVDANGEESGSSLAASIAVSAGGGIDLSAIPQPLDAAVTAIRVYMTKPNGKILRRAGVVTLGATTYHLDRRQLGAPLRSQFLSAIPGVNAAAFSGGRFWFAIGSMVGYSDSLYYGLWNPANNYFSYPHDVSMLAPAQMQKASVAAAGIFVGTFDQRDNELPTGATYFLSGTGPDDYRNVSAYRAGAVPGMLTYMPGCYFEDDNIPTDVVPVWGATNGTPIVGLPNGVAKCMTEGRFAMTVGARGSAVFRERDGIRQVLFTMEPSDRELPITATDSLTITRVTNGITQL